MGLLGDVEKGSPLSSVERFFSKTKISVWTIIAAVVLLAFLFVLGLHSGQKPAKRHKKKAKKVIKVKKTRASFCHKNKRKKVKKKSHKKVRVVKVRTKTRKKHLPVKTVLFVLLLLLFLAATVYAALYIPPERFSPSRWISYGEFAWESTKVFVKTGMGLGVLSTVAFVLSFLGGYGITRLLTKKPSAKRSR